MKIGKPICSWHRLQLEKFFYLSDMQIPYYVSTPLCGDDDASVVVATVALPFLRGLWS